MYVPSAGNRLIGGGQVFGVRKMWYGLGSLVQVIMVTIIALNVMCVPYAWLFGTGPARRVVMPFNLAAVLFGLYSIMKYSRHILGVGTDGVMLYDRRRCKQEYFDWDTIRQIRRKWSSILVIVTGDAGIKCDVGSTAESKRCAYRINQYLQRSKG